MIPSYRVLGIAIHAVQVPGAVEIMRQWVLEKGRPRIVSLTGMHGIMEARYDRAHRNILNNAELSVADGWPIAMLGRLQGYPMHRRVYGPELMEDFFASAPGLKHYFYGGVPGVAEDLAEHFLQKFGVHVVGTHSPRMGPLSPREHPEVIREINDSGADVIWVGLGAPKQEQWMASRRNQVNVPLLVGVGAAFDFHTGRISQAPGWMRENGLEWLFRLWKEPRRLWRRYILLGGEFSLLILLHVFTGGLRRVGRAPR